MKQSVKIDVSELLYFVGKITPVHRLELTLITKYTNPSLGSLLDRWLTFIETSYPDENINYGKLIMLMSTLNKIVSMYTPSIHGNLIKTSVTNIVYNHRYLELEIEYDFE